MSRLSFVTLTPTSLPGPSYVPRVTVYRLDSYKMVLSFRTALVILGLLVICIFLWTGRRYAFSRAYTSTGIFFIVWCIMAFPVRLNQARHCSLSLSTFA